MVVPPWPAPGFDVNSHFRFCSRLFNAFVVPVPPLAVPQSRPYHVPVDLMVSEAGFDA